MVLPVLISDPDDPRIAVYRDIRERDLIGRKDRFIAEGKVVLNVLATQRRFSVESVLVLENKLPGVEAVLGLLPLETQVFTVKRAVMDTVAGFPVHRGILAVGRRNGADNPRELLGSLPAKAVVLLLCGIANHDNTGAIFRNAAAFGAGLVLLDPQCCDPLYRKAIRVSVGAALTVPFERVVSQSEALAMLREHGFDIISLSPSGTTDLGSLHCSPRTAFVLGTEGAGLPASILSATKPVRIPIRKDFDSLNVAAASAIALHHYRSVPHTGS